MEDEGAAVAQVVDYLEVVDVAVHRVGQLSGTGEQRQVVPNTLSRGQRDIKQHLVVGRHIATRQALVSG